jgi:hypothetical protein
MLAGPMRALADAVRATVQAALEPALFAEAFATILGFSRYSSWHHRFDDQIIVESGILGRNGGVTYQIKPHG